MSIVLIEPLDTSNAVVSQDYDEHVQRAIRNGWCYMPGPNCATWYYGGIDWAYRNNLTPDIWASADGVVEQVYAQTGGYGTGVRLKHDEGWVTIYAHMKDVIVSVGEKVKVKQKLGRGDNTGNSTGPHLHFELRNPQGNPTDPMPYLYPYQPSSFEYPGLYVKPAKIRITASPYLRIRREPKTTAVEVGRLYQGEIVEVIELKQIAYNEIWAKVGYNQWCAPLHPSGLGAYAEWLKD